MSHDGTFNTELGSATHQNFRRLGGDPERTPVILRVEDVIAKSVDWLWYGRIPKGNLTMIDGDPGQGKSWVTLAIASAVTRGSPLPGHSSEQLLQPGNVLLLTAEDSPADTIRPRLESLGADLSRVEILSAVRNPKGEESHLSLISDIKALELALVEGNHSLVIIDPLNAYLGGSLDTHKDAAMRSALAPLAQLADRYNVAILCIRHLTKSGRDKAIYRGQGSIAYTAAARVAHLVGTYEGTERVIVCIKNNLAPFPPSVAFEIKNGCLLWKGETDISVNALLTNDASSEERTTALDKAIVFLEEALSKKERPAKEIQQEAQKATISERTLKRAKAALRIDVWKVGAGKEGFWMWSLPSDTPKEAETEGESIRPSLNKDPVEAENPKKAADSPSDPSASFESKTTTCAKKDDNSSENKNHPQKNNDADHDQSGPLQDPHRYSKKVVQDLKDMKKRRQAAKKIPPSPNADH